MGFVRVFRLALFSRSILLGLVLFCRFGCANYWVICMVCIRLVILFFFLLSMINLSFLRRKKKKKLKKKSENFGKLTAKLTKVLK